MAQIELKNITKEWGGFIGVNNLNLKINDKEFIVLLGPQVVGRLLQ